MRSVSFCDMLGFAERDMSHFVRRDMLGKAKRDMSSLPLGRERLLFSKARWGRVLGEGVTEVPRAASRGLLPSFSCENATSLSEGGFLSCVRYQVQER